MQYRLIVSDIDGTLTHEWDGVNLVNQRVLQELNNQGVAFMIATGRSFRASKRILDSLDFSCYACLVNGAVLISYPEEKLLATKYIALEDKNQLLERIMRAGGHLTTYSGYETGDIIYYHPNYHQSPFLNEIIHPDHKDQQMVEDMITDIHHPVPVLSCVGTLGEIEAVQRELVDFRERFNIIRLKDTYKDNFYWLMITRKDADKVRGIQDIAAMLGIKREEIIAIGDDLNDLEMIKYAGLGIAMENGVDELKAAADLIAPPCTENGLAQILQQIYQL